MDPLGLSSEVAKDGYTAFKKWVRDVKKFREDIGKVKALHHELENESKEMEQLVALGREKNEVPTVGVAEWLKEADALLALKEQDETWKELFKVEMDSKRVRYNLFRRHHLSKEAMKKSDLITEKLHIIRDRGQLPLTQPIRVGFGDTRSAYFCEGLQSRENSLDAIFAALKDDNVNRIGLHGMGGAGKSTLVQEVAYRAGIGKLFDETVIAEISKDPKDPDFRRIQDQIAGCINFNLDAHASTDNRARHLGKRLKDSLMGNKSEDDKSNNDKHKNQKEVSAKILLILDNMWSTLDLQLVGIPCEVEDNMRCKIIVTSRNENVCKAMGVTDDYVIKVGDLTHEEARNLFKQRVGRSLDGDDYKEIAEEILQICSRLPLSINLLANALKNQTLSVWKNILLKLQNPLPAGENGAFFGEVYSIIQISYSCLRDKEKKLFFLLCCIFPPASTVLIFDVLKYGIAMRLFEYTNSLAEAINRVHEWTDELTSLSLFKEFDPIKGEIIIHDDVRDTGIRIAKTGEHKFHVGAMPKWLSEDSYKRLAVISMESDNSDCSHESLRRHPLSKLQLLRCLDVKSPLDDNFFKSMRNLKVLDMSKSTIKIVPKSIAQLEHLETLLLQNCSLEDVSHICRLQKLRVLSFRGSDIITLPKELASLVTLRLLDLTSCEKLKEIPANTLGRLTQLEGLYMSNTFDNWGIDRSMASIEELSSLPLYVLEIEVNNVEQLRDRVFPCLAHPFSSYTIRCGELKSFWSDWTEWKKGEGRKGMWRRLGSIVSGLRTCSILLPPSSRHLQIGGENAPDLVKDGWKLLINKAASLHLNDIHDLRNVAPYLGEDGMTELKRMQITCCDTMECLINGKTMSPLVAFPKLEILLLEALPQLTTICDERRYLPDLFSALQELTLSELNKLGPSALLIQHAVKLKSLKVENCKNLKYVFSASATTTCGDQLFEFPCLWSLKLVRLPKLRGLLCTTTDQADNQDNHHLFSKKIKFLVLDKLFFEELDGITSLWDEFATGEEFSLFFPKLRSISLNVLPKIKCVWSDRFSNSNRGSLSLASLKKLKVYRCNSLETICSPAIADGLEALEYLHVIYSDNVRQIISAEPQDDNNNSKIKFPMLLTLECHCLPELTCIYKGRLEIEFPSLKILNLDTLSKLKTFSYRMTKPSIIKQQNSKDDDDDNGILFNKEVKFPVMEKLDALCLPKIVMLWNCKTAQEFSDRFPHLQSLYLVGMDSLKHVWNKELCRVSNDFPNLKNLSVDSCDSLESIFGNSAAAKSTETVNLKFSTLQTVKLSALSSFNNFLQGKIQLEFPALKELKLTSLDCMKTFAGLENSEENEGSSPQVPLFSEKISIPSLEKLKLLCLPNVQLLWVVSTPNQPNTSNHAWNNNLNEVAIACCGNLKCLGSFTGNSSPEQFSFSKLKKLELIDLEKLTCLFQGLPMIKKIITRPQTFKEFGIAEETNTVKEDEKGIENVDCEESVDDLGEQESSATKARQMEKQNINTRLFSETAEMPSLEELNIEEMPEPEQIHDTIEEDQNAFAFPNLKILHLENVKWKLFQTQLMPKLSSLSIWNVHGLRCLVSPNNVPSDGALFRSISHLAKLEDLVVGDCDDMEAIVSKEECPGVQEEDNELVFPNLREIELNAMCLLYTISATSHTIRFPSLERLRLYNCLMIRSFSSTLPEAPKLRGVYLHSELHPIDEDHDHNSILEQIFVSEHKYEKYWPSAIKHKPREEEAGEHEMRIAFKEKYRCKGCNDRGKNLLYRCSRCDSDFHPQCVLEDTQITEDPNELEVLRNWPKDWKSKLHRHELKLMPCGGHSECRGCDGKTTLIAYTCACCYFYLHPKCAAEVTHSKTEELGYDFEIQEALSSTDEDMVEE